MNEIDEAVADSAQGVIRLWHLVDTYRRNAANFGLFSGVCWRLDMDEF